MNSIKELDTIQKYTLWFIKEYAVFPDLVMDAVRKEPPVKQLPFRMRFGSAFERPVKTGKMIDSVLTFQVSIAILLA